jgi:Protein of unknown function (DUF3294)
LDFNQAAPPWVEELRATLTADITANITLNVAAQIQRLRADLERGIRNMTSRSFNLSAVGDCSLLPLENADDEFPPADSFPLTPAAFHSLEDRIVKQLLLFYGLEGDNQNDTTKAAKAAKLVTLGKFIGVRP